MSFLDKAKEKATQLTQQAKEKIDDIKVSRKADDLLDDLGRISYRAHTNRAEPGDADAVVDLVAQLQALEREGVDVLAAKEKAAATGASSTPATTSTTPAPATPTTSATSPATGSAAPPMPAADLPPPMPESPGV